MSADLAHGAFFPDIAGGMFVACRYDAFGATPALLAELRRQHGAPGAWLLLHNTRGFECQGGPAGDDLARAALGAFRAVRGTAPSRVALFGDHHSGDFVRGALMTFLAAAIPGAGIAQLDDPQLRYVGGGVFEK
jgi:hypothetical protein